MKGFDMLKQLSGQAELVRKLVDEALWTMGSLCEELDVDGRVNQALINVIKDAVTQVPLKSKYTAEQERITREYIADRLTEALEAAESRNEMLAALNILSAQTATEFDEQFRERFLNKK